nr:hypothetical protein [Tanacetum cinerariifolium]
NAPYVVADERDDVVVRGDDVGSGGCSDEVMMLARCGGLDGGDEPVVMAAVVRLRYGCSRGERRGRDGRLELLGGRVWLAFGGARENASDVVIVVAVRLFSQSGEDSFDDISIKKKRKHADDIHDYFTSTKRYKSSVKYEDHLVETILNEPSLGRILFNSHQRQDFVSIEDFEDLSNELFYTVQEILFRLHQGPGQGDHARTFSSFLAIRIFKWEEIVGSVPEPYSLLVDLNIKYPKCSLAEDSSALVLQVLKRSSSIFTSVYVAVQKLKKTLVRASVQLGCQGGKKIALCQKK